MGKLNYVDSNTSAVLLYGKTKIFCCFDYCIINNLSLLISFKLLIFDFFIYIIYFELSFEN